MAQIAQQDHLFVVDDVNAIESLGESQKAKLKACIVGGTIFDVVLKTKQAENIYNYSRIVAYYVDQTDKQKPTYTVIAVNSETGMAPTIKL